jgi:hypothetical protein
MRRQRSHMSEIGLSQIGETPQELHANAALGLKRHGPYDEDQNRSDT